MSQTQLIDTLIYSKEITELIQRINASEAGEQHKALLDFSESFSAYLVGFLLGEYKLKDAHVEKIETQFWLHRKAKLSFGIYVSYLRELGKALPESVLNEHFHKKRKFEAAANLSLVFDSFKAMHKDGFTEESSFESELAKKMSGKNPSKINLMGVFDLLTQIRNRYAHAADYQWPLGSAYYQIFNPPLLDTVNELISTFGELAPYQLVMVDELKADDKKVKYLNLESQGDQALEVRLADEDSELLIEDKHFILDQSQKPLFRYYKNELPLPNREVAEKCQSQDRLKMIEPTLRPAIEQCLQNDDTIDSEEYEQLQLITKNAEIEEEKFHELIYNVAKEMGIESDPLMMEKGLVQTLVTRYTEGKEHFENPHYSETQLRVEFIDKLFEALDWDVSNSRLSNEVKREHAVGGKKGARGTRVDYAFCQGLNDKFYVEAKAPHVNIKKDTSPALQIRNYSWNKGLPLGIVTNFKELAIYDCRIKVNKDKDTAKTGLVFYCTYDQYLEKWDEIKKFFSKKSVLAGSLDEYAGKKKKTLQTVDEAFLEDMENWRELLASDIGKNNPELKEDLDELNHMVQLTIDRIVFLRIAEDRQLEPENTLLDITKSDNMYKALFELYHQADQKYNSGLFHFKEEKDDPEGTFVDDITQGLNISNECLKKVVDSLYDSAYDFSVLPPEILGQAYEQFLGKVITLDGDNIKIEEKPEVKKAGGVYYTPRYIVDYIIENTLGKKLEGQTPDSIKNLSVLDPACGSGSFLIRAFQYLLDWHLAWYKENNPEKHAKAGKNNEPILYAIKVNNLEGQEVDEYHLTLIEKRRILTEHIFGVDIDGQAVEVTKLSLLLLVMEGYINENPQMELFRVTRILPNLGGNIKCGNSLIGSDIKDNEEIAAMGRSEIRKTINPFDWEYEFEDIMKRGGFDVVVGNPPYILLEDVNRDSKILDYIKKTSKSASSYKIDTYHLFIEHGV